MTAPAVASPEHRSPGQQLRRGLPRVAGAEPWPPATTSAQSSPVPVEAASGAPASVPAPAEAAAPSPVTEPTSTPVHQPIAQGSAAIAVRRGLPRVAGEDPWPPASTRAGSLATTSEDIAESVPVANPVVSAAGGSPRRDISVPLAVPTGVTPGRYAFEHLRVPEPKRVGPFTRPQALGLTAVAGFALIAGAFLLVTFTRWILSLEGPNDFITTYPGEYDLPESATPGFPLWVQWQHFFNIFLMVSIIRSGWLVRTERRPEAFFTARWSQDQKKKISLNLWFHQALDVLWVLNGVIFVVLLFASGHWMRIVPTSWEVFPNALSAVAQYISLDWPTEHGWVNYNSIQQLMYFTVVFIAAPLAAITGVRMSGVWPKKAATLNRIYPVEVARAIHFPVMLFFVLFIIVHVALVFATGALRNLNHMFGGTDLVNWTGFWIFVVAMAVTAGLVFASRTLVLAPIAKLFGTVSQR